MRVALRRSLAVLLAAAVLWLPLPAPAEAQSRDPGSLRVALFNASLSREGAGLLLRDIRKRDEQVLNVARIILRVRPDILILNEIDRDPGGAALSAFAALLAEGVDDLAPLTLTHAFHAPVNTGRPSGLDLDGDGAVMGPNDAWGYGLFPGQYGMAVLSRFPIRTEAARTYHRFRWSDLPDADRPRRADGAPYHDDATWAALRLSSKSHWSVPVALPQGKPLHLLMAHPTPPVFDGPEDRNGRRNGDEIRLLTALIDGPHWLTDDAGRAGGMPADEPFVVAGDLNADPNDGEGGRAALRALLSHPRVQDPEPESAGAAAKALADGGANLDHMTRAALDTADWRDTRGGPGNLRVDYVLPSRDLMVTGSGVFWPAPDDPAAALVRGGRRLASSDHRLVWLDLVVP